LVLNRHAARDLHAGPRPASCRSTAENYV